MGTTRRLLLKGLLWLRGVLDVAIFKLEEPVEPPAVPLLPTTPWEETPRLEPVSVWEMDVREEEARETRSGRYQVAADPIEESDAFRNTLAEVAKRGDRSARYVRARGSRIVQEVEE